MSYAILKSKLLLVFSPSNAAEDSLKYIPPVEDVALLYVKSLVNLASKNVFNLDGAPKTLVIKNPDRSRALAFGGSSGFCAG